MNGQSLRSQKLIQKKHDIQTAWMSNFEFSNVDKSALPEIQSFTVLNPVLEQFFYTEAGELNIHHASYVASSIFLIIFGILACCCWKSPSFRQFFITKGTFLGNYIYHLFTTETYRLKKESEELNEEIEKNWNELKKMENLIAKKAELKKRLPNLEENPEPSAPLQSGARTHAEVHPPHLPSSSGRPSLKGPTSSSSHAR